MTKQKIIAKTLILTIAFIIAICTTPILLPRSKAFAEGTVEITPRFPFETVKDKCKEFTDSDVLEGAAPIDVCTSEKSI